MAKLSEYINDIELHTTELQKDNGFHVKLLNDYHVKLENEDCEINIYSYRFEETVSIQLWDKVNNVKFSFGKLLQQLNNPTFPTVDSDRFKDGFAKDLFWKIKILELAYTS